MAKRKYTDLKKLIDEAVSFQKRDLYPRARVNLANLKGYYVTEKDYLGVMAETDDPIYEINLAYSITRTMLTSVYANDPEFTFFIKGEMDGIENTGFTRQSLSHAMEYGTKVYFKEMKSRNTNRKTIIDTSWAGYGVTKMGYSLELGSTDKPEVSTDTDYNEIIKRDEPYKLRINPLDILFNKNDESLDELTWVCQIVYKTKDQAKKDYGVDLPTVAMDEIRKDETRKGRLDKVKIYEFHDLNSEEPMIYTLAEGHPELLNAKPYPILDEATGNAKSLFQFLWFNDNPNGLYPQADLDLVLTQIIEARYCAQKRIEFIRKFSRKYAMTGNWEDEGKAAFRDGEDGAIIESKETGSSISVIDNPTLGQDFYQNVALIKQEMMEILGLTDYQVGGGTQERKATEAQLVEKGRLDRVGDRVRIVEEFVYSQVDTFIELLKEFKKTSRIFTLYYDEKRTVFEMSGELMKLADIDIQVVEGSTVSLDKNAATRRMMEVAQVAQAFPDFVNRQEVFKELLKTTGVRDPQRFILPGVAPAPGVMPGADGVTPAIGGQVPMQGQEGQTPDDLGMTNIPGEQIL